MNERPDFKAILLLAEPSRGNPASAAHDVTACLTAIGDACYMLIMGDADPEPTRKFSILATFLSFVPSHG